MVSRATTQVCCCSVKAATGNMWVNRQSSDKTLFKKQATGMIWFMFCLFSNPGLDQLSSVGRKNSRFYMTNEYCKEQKMRTSAYIYIQNKIYSPLLISIIQIGIGSCLLSWPICWVVTCHVCQGGASNPGVYTVLLTGIFLLLLIHCDAMQTL